MRKLSRIIILLVCLVACKHKSVELIKERDLKLDFGSEDGRFISGYEADTASYLLNLNSNSKSLEFINVNTNRMDDSISLVNLDSSHEIKYTVGFYVHNKDSVFFAFQESNKLFLLDHEGKIKNQWMIDGELSNHIKKYSFISRSECPLYYHDHTIYILGSPNNLYPGNPKLYSSLMFGSVPEIAINIAKENFTMSNTTGKWPDMYKQGFDYYEYWPSRCVNDRGQLIYSFGVNDSLFIYEGGKLMQTVNAKSKYFGKITSIPHENLTNLAYIKKYWVTEPKYERIIYDKYRNWYYRIVKHSEEYENPDGTVKQPWEKSWSVMILDQDFEILDEIKFDPKVYNPYLFAPTKEGIIIAKCVTTELPHTRRSFSLFKPVIKTK